MFRIRILRVGTRKVTVPESGGEGLQASKLQPNGSSEKRAQPRWWGSLMAETVPRVDVGEGSYHDGPGCNAFSGK